jgi:hypothetical protein
MFYTTEVNHITNKNSVFIFYFTLRIYPAHLIILYIIWGNMETVHMSCSLAGPRIPIASN